MKKFLLLIVIFIYVFIVAGWWIEGTINRNQQKTEQYELFAQ